MICDSLIVYRHEVSRLLRSLRFRVSFVLIVLLFAGGSRLFVSLYMEQQAAHLVTIYYKTIANHIF
jgi:ABC-type Na+ efflux pump permease subunit